MLISTAIAGCILLTGATAGAEQRALVATAVSAEGAQGDGEGPESSSGNSKSSGSKSSGKSSSKSKWKTDFYLDPLLGGSSYTSGGSTSVGLSLGGEAGVQYRQRGSKYPKLIGKARVRGEYLIGTVTGTEIRVGNFIGPWWRVGNIGAGVTTGPDVFWNKYSWDNIELDPTTGLAWPVIGQTSFSPLSLYAGVSPAWYLSGDRVEVDWDKEDSFGFGHEFTYLAGVALSSKVISLSLSWSRRVTSSGDQVGYGIGFSIGG